MADFVIDTDVASVLRKGRAPDWVVRRVTGSRTWITFVTAGELWKWAEVRSWGERNRSRLDYWIRQRPMLPFDVDVDVAERWGKLSASAQQRGRPRPQNDTWIAACCIRHELPLLTLNQRDSRDFEDDGRDPPPRALVAFRGSLLSLERHRPTDLTPLDSEEPVSAGQHVYRPIPLDCPPRTACRRSGGTAARPYACCVTELRVVVSEEIAERFACEADRRGTSTEDVAAEVLVLHAPPLPNRRRPRFVGKGHSGRHDLSERVEEILAADLGT